MSKNPSILVKHFVLLLVLISSVTTAIAQQLSVRPQWSAPADDPLLAHRAPELVVADDDAPPILYSIQLLDGAYAGVTVDVVDAVYADISAPASWTAERQGKESLVTSADVLTTKGTRVAKIGVQPFRKQGNGQWQRLESATLDVRGEGLSATRQAGVLSFADESRLSGGEWFKLNISRDGVYKVDRGMLSSLGVDVGALDPNDLNIYGNDEGLLPRDNSVFRYDDLQPKAIEIVGGDDGSFDSGDYILFHAKDADGWAFQGTTGEYIHEKHLFTSRAHVYIGIGVDPPVRVQQAAAVIGTADMVVESFDAFSFYEVDADNIIESGRQLVGESFTLEPQRTFSGGAFNFPNIDTESEAIVTVSAASRTYGGTSSINFSANGNERSFTIPTSGQYSILRFEHEQLTFLPTSDDLSTTVRFNPGSGDSEGWLDYIRLQVRRKLIRTNEQFEFRDSQTMANGTIAEFRIEGIREEDRVWALSPTLRPERVSVDVAGDFGSFLSETGTQSGQPREYVIFSAANTFSPGLGGRVDNQNLHSMTVPDMVIISSVPFMSVAEKFAEMHRQEGLSVFVTTPQPIYEEFSCGMQDVTAIKMFMKMFYDRALGDPTKMVDYLMLVGDGTYKNNTIDPASSIFLPLHQSLQSESLTSTYLSDDYFGFLDDNEVEGRTSSEGVDLGVGRLTVKTLQEAEDVYQKTKNYLSPNTGMAGGHCVQDNGIGFGDWRTDVLIVGDDEDGNLHMRDADELAETVRGTNADYNISKIFLDAYPQETTPGGARYPEAQRDLADGIESGKFIVSYSGHGGEVGWAEERILDVATVQGFTNRDRLPILLTATCEFSRFDDPDRTSAGELMLLNPNGGAIALMTTTRLVVASANLAIGNAFYKVALDESQTSYTCDGVTFEFPHGKRLGDIIRISKICAITSNAVNTLNFSLLGDPAVIPARPTLRVDETVIKNQDGEAIQALGALQRVTVSGAVVDAQGQTLTDFDGVVEPRVYDKEKTISGLMNDGGAAFDFEVQNSVIYKGKATVTDGLFDFTFIVPRDIGYQEGQARISYYALGDETDAIGHFSDFTVGTGEGDYEIPIDEVGPDIELYLDNEDFVSGGLTNESPLLIAELVDSNGINTVGNGIGHDITVVIDENTNNTIVLNDEYESDLDSYQSGRIQYELRNLEPGPHTLTLKVWDILNNSSSKTIDFVVSESQELVLDNVINYPNPFTTRTEFMFEHNQACEFLDVSVQVFTVSGKLVRTIHRTIDPDMPRADPITWDGRDDFGDRIGRGVYVYKLEVVTPDGKKEEQFEKLVVL